MAKKLIPTAPVAPVTPTLSGALASKTTPVSKAPTTTPTVSNPATSMVKKGGTAPLAPFASMATGIAAKKADPVPPAPITNAAMGGTAGSTGFGGATYGSSAGANAAITANESRLASDPAFKESETARTLAQIEKNKALGVSTSEQEKYLYKNLGYNPSTGNTAAVNSNAQNGVAFSGETNPNNTNYGQYVPGNTPAPPSWATAEEETWLKNQIAGMQGLSDTYKGQLNSALDQNNSYIAQQIDAAQQMQNRRGGLYSGGYDYQAGTLTSEGLKRQADLQNQYGNQISSIAQQINNLQQAQPEILRQRIQEYINNDRNYALNWAGTFGNLGGVNTQSMQGQLFNQDMTGKQFDWQKAMDQANLTGQYNGQSTLAGKQANWNAYMDMVNQTGQLGKGPAQNWTNYVANANAGNQTMGGQQNASGLASDQQARATQQLNNAWATASQLGKVTKELAALTGIPEGTPTLDAIQIANQQSQFDQNFQQQQDEFDDNSAYKWAGLDADLAAAANQGEQYQGMTAGQVVTNVRTNYGDKDGKIPAGSQDAAYLQIVASGLPEDQENQALASIGLTSDQIKSLDDKYLSK